MKEAVDLFGWNLLAAMGAVALAGSLLSGKNWGSRAFHTLGALVILSLGWIMVAGVAYIGVNLVAEFLEAVNDHAFSADGRAVLSKWLGFAGVALFYAKYVWEEYHTPAKFAGPRLVVGAPRPGRNLPQWR